MNLHHRVHIFIIRIWEQNDFLFNGIVISDKVELRFPYTGQVMDFTPDYSTGFDEKIADNTQNALESYDS